MKIMSQCDNCDNSHAMTLQAAITRGTKKRQEKIGDEQSIETKHKRTHEQTNEREHLANSLLTCGIPPCADSYLGRRVDGAEIVLLTSDMRILLAFRVDV